MVRVGFVFPNFHVGGAERSLMVLAAAMGEMGVDVALFPLWEDGLLHPGSLMPVYALATKQHWLLPVASLRLARTLGRWRPDAVIATLWSAIATAGVARCARGARWPLVTVEHNLASWYAPRVRLGNVKRRMIRAVHRRASAVIAPSDLVRRELISSGVPARLVRVIPNPIPIPQATSAIPTDPVTLTCIGRLFRYKRVDAVIRAVPIIQRASGCAVQLQVVGDGPRRGELERMVNQLGLGHHVRFAGSVRDVTPFYEQSTFVIHVPERESFGNVVGEAMAHQRVALVSPPLLESLPFLRPGENVLACDGTPEGIAHTIANSLERLDDVFLIGERARRTAESILSPRRVAQDYLAVLT